MSVCIYDVYVFMFVMHDMFGMYVCMFDVHGMYVLWMYFWHVCMYVWPDIYVWHVMVFMFDMHEIMSWHVCKYVRKHLCLYAYMTCTSVCHVCVYGRHGMYVCMYVWQLICLVCLYAFMSARIYMTCMFVCHVCMFVCHICMFGRIASKKGTGGKFWIFKTKTKQKWATWVEQPTRKRQRKIYIGLAKRMSSCNRSCQRKKCVQTCSRHSWRFALLSHHLIVYHLTVFAIL